MGWDATHPTAGGLEAPRYKSPMRANSLHAAVALRNPQRACKTLQSMRMTSYQLLMIPTYPYDNTSRLEMLSPR